MQRSPISLHFRVESIVMELSDTDLVTRIASGSDREAEAKFCRLIGPRIREPEKLASIGLGTCRMTALDEHRSAPTPQVTDPIGVLSVWDHRRRIDSWQSNGS